MASCFLRTERLGFRSWTKDDLDLALGLWGDPEVTRLIDARGRLSREQVRERLAEEIACEREHGVHCWPIFLRAGGELEARVRRRGGVCGDRARV